MASGTIKVHQQFLFEEVEIADTTIAANTGSDFTLDVSKVGYTPVGIVQIRKVGANYASVPISRFYIDSSNIAHIAAYNTGSSSRSIEIHATIMYQKA